MSALPPPSSPDQGLRRSEVALIAFAVAVGTAISMMVQGFSVNNNNIYHIPIILDWLKEPAFADDAFIQSLDNYVSGFWLLIRVIATADNYHWIFIGLQIVIRYAIFASLVASGYYIGIRSRSSIILLIAVLITAPIPRGTSPVGDGAVFSEQLTHTEVALALVIVSLALMTWKRVFLGFAITGFVFNCNAFVALWSAVSLTCSSFLLHFYRAITLRELRRKIFIGAGVSIVIAIPVIIWIFEVLLVHGRPLDFDYLQYLIEYYPNHFLISSAKLQGLLAMAAVVLGGISCVRILGAAGAVWSGALVGLCGLFVVGMILPSLTSARIIFNFHFLRADGLIELIVVFLIATIATQRISESQALDRLAGALALSFLALPIEGGMALAGSLLLGATPRISRGLATAVGVAAVALAVSSLDRSWFRKELLGGLEIAATLAWFVMRSLSLKALPLPVWMARGGVLAIMVASLALALHDRSAVSPRTLAAQQTGQWAAQNTPADSLFLVPPEAGAFGDSDFQLASHRKVWVDWKRGAAVMWEPSYYREWSSRLAEARALSSPAQWLSYACRNHIDYVVLERKSMDATLPLGASQPQSPAAPVACAGSSQSDCENARLSEAAIVFAGDYYVILDTQRSCRR